MHRVDILVKFHFSNFLLYQPVESKAVQSDSHNCMMYTCKMGCVWKRDGLWGGGRGVSK